MPRSVFPEGDHRCTRLPRLQVASDELLHLDLVRFVASIGIVFLHSHLFFYSAEQRAAVHQVTGGLALFVDLFFVISGFIIASIYHDRVGHVKEIGRFMQRRIGRLVPLHWLTLALSIGLWAILASFAHGAHQPDFSPICIINNALLLHAFVTCGQFQFNAVTWSIGAEMVMYLLFPIIALLGRRWRSAPLVMGIAILGTLFIRTYGIDLDGGPYMWTALHPVLRALPTFLIGAGLFYCPVIARKVPSPQLCLGLALATLIAAMLTGMPGPLQLLLIGAVAVSAIASDMKRRRGPFIRSIAPLGQLTYSIYMWHTLFILALMNAVGDKILHNRTRPMMLLTLLCYGAILAWSYISFSFIETPARRWVDGLFGGHRRLHGVPG